VTRRFAALDGLRALAALAILGVHAMQAWSPAVSRPPGMYAVHVGSAAVVVFFVLSGFLLYRPFVRAAAALGPRVAWRSYLLRRALRILPAYWVALTVLGVAAGLPGVFGERWWAFYGFMQVYSLGTAQQGLAPAWSLCVEVVFYAVLPLLAAGLATGSGRGGRWRPGRQVAAIGGLAGVSFALNVWLAAESSRPYLGSTFPCAFVYLAAGMALAVVSVALETGTQHRWAVWVQAACRPRLAWALAGAGFVVVVAGLGLSHTATYPIPRTPAQSVAEVLLTAVAGVLVVGAAALGRGPAMLASRPAVWLGTVSYGLFLWHYPIVDSLGRRDDLRSLPLAPLVFAVAAVGASLAAAALSWYLLERPLISLVRRAPMRAAEAPRPAPREHGPVRGRRGEPHRSPLGSGLAAHAAPQPQAGDAPAERLD
jgi:peptidoglycan/LPS O-acetylase OafA/YrhL